MLQRRRRQCVVWIIGFVILLAVVVSLKSAYNFYVYRQLVSKLKPGEHVVDLGSFNPQTFMKKVKPDWDIMRNSEFPNASIPYGRMVPDTRPSNCMLKSLQLISLPEASVVMVLQGEPRHTVFRTIYSILLRTPPELLREIVVIDDAIEDVAMGSLLSRIPKVKVTRNSKMEGMIKSMNTGANLAVSPILIFVTSKCEVNVHWLQPLLQRLVHNNPAGVVAPVLDTISSTGEYSPNEELARAGFDWSLSSKLEGNAIGEQVFSSPIYRGHVFSIGRERFLKLGKFDPGFESYGGENIELSLKTWLCGGRVEIHTCSRIGQIHVEEELTGLRRGHENIYLRNVKRVAEAWLDDYKRFFYYTKPFARMVNAGSIAERKSLRQHLKCQTFKWYMDNVYIELRPPVTDEIMFGTIRQQDFCVDIEIGHVPAVAKLVPCNPDKSAQDWSFKKKGEITSGGMCLSADPIETHGYVMVHFCTNLPSQKWLFLDGQIFREGTDQCLDSHKANVALVIAECDEQYVSQRWRVVDKSQQSRSKDEV
ncbi:hypothetical protein DPMN_071351 [Dreissena polymorpha]|uniref:Polypeptide N-acetylgalactosaminyltransferase n=2 Tax=Dreissena polymorpha TaxID=45954 RepID=A0A9D4BW62_DREPO|nr:hypothetical protein DPMN_071351 [Dreissena polymorpha]